MGGDPQLVPLGYTINALLQCGILLDALGYALDEDKHSVLEEQYSRPIEEMVQQVATATYILLDRTTEAHNLPIPFRREGGLHPAE